METKDLNFRINKLKLDIENLINHFNKETELHVDYLQVIPDTSNNQIIIDSYKTEIVFKF